MRLLVILAALALFAATVDCAPFFDAIYDALNGNGRRSYGYSGYGNGGYGGYGAYDGDYRNYGYGQPYDSAGYAGKKHTARPRTGKSWKELCSVHFPQSVAVPGTGGIICPY